VWHINSAPFPGSHFACVDSETEALTPFGWKTYDQLSNGDLIAGYDQEGHFLSWQPAEFWAYQVNCELVKIEKRDSSQRLTENHRCLIRRRDGGEAVVLASDLKPGMEIPIVAPLSIPETDGPGADLAALLGWYLTEGERKRHRIIRINQSMSANPEKVEAIRALLVRLGAELSVRRR
jgi:intein/homing endonuclease